MDRGLLQREAAGEMGVSPDTVRNWEAGRTEPAIGRWPGIITFLGFLPFEVGASLPERIVGYRTVRGLPRAALADRLGIDESTLWRWESGRGKPTGDRRRRLDALLRSADGMGSSGTGE